MLTQLERSNDKIASHVRAPLPTVGIPSVMEVQKRVAAVTIITPFIGTVVAISLAAVNGIGKVEILSFVLMYFIANSGIEFGFHRNLAHNAFKAKKWMSYLFAIFGSMAAQGGVCYWVATHRRHHIHSDTEHDPHSPHVRNISDREEKMGRIKGVLHSHIGWMFNDKMTNCSMFAKDMIKDSGFKKINDLYIPIVFIGVLLPGLICFLITGSAYAALMGILWGGAVRMFVGHHSTWLNSSFSHLYGGRPFQTDDQSANNLWCAIPTFGASFQNNHHAFPWSAHLGFKWWQIDIAGYLVHFFKIFGLVWNVRYPTDEQMERKKIGMN